MKYVERVVPSKLLIPVSRCAQPNRASALCTAFLRNVIIGWRDQLRLFLSWYDEAE